MCLSRMYLFRRRTKTLSPPLPPVFHLLLLLLPTAPFVQVKPTTPVFPQMHRTGAEGGEAGGVSVFQPKGEGGRVGNRSLRIRHRRRRQSLSPPPPPPPKATNGCGPRGNLAPSPYNQGEKKKKIASLPFLPPCLRLIPADFFPIVLHYHPGPTENDYEKRRGYKLLGKNGPLC